MKTPEDAGPKLRPIILAGGLGTRLRPRTEHLPKPLLPVDGRPLLWHAVNSLGDCNLLPPLVALDYLRPLIRAFFSDTTILFHDLPGMTMAEAVLEIVQRDDADAFLGMSSDVLVPRRAVKEITRLYYANGRKDTALFVQMPVAGHKKWEFSVVNGELRDVRVRETKTNFERVLLILNRASLQKIRERFPAPITEDSLSPELKLYQTGWTLLLKSLLDARIPVVAQIVDIPVCNINAAADFQTAEDFVRREMA